MQFKLPYRASLAGSFGAAIILLAQNVLLDSAIKSQYDLRDNKEMGRLLLEIISVWYLNYPLKGIIKVKAPMW